MVRGNPANDVSATSFVTKGVSPCLREPNHARGFTLIELMVTLAVFAILLMIAVPSFKHILVSTHLAGVNNELAGDLQFARTEAVSRQVDVSVAASSGDWQNGWTVQAASASTAPGAPAVVLRRHSAIPDQYVVDAAAATTVSYQPQGTLSNINGTCFTISAPDSESNDPHYLQVLGGGMLRQQTGGATPNSPNCPAP